MMSTSQAVAMALAIRSDLDHGSADDGTAGNLQSLRVVLGSVSQQQVGLAVSRDQIVLAAGESTGNIWVARRP
jgi:hypothetical protein